MWINSTIKYPAARPVSYTHLDVYKSQAKFYTDAFFADCEKLQIRKPDTVVPATTCVDDFIRMISVLLEKGYAYLAGGNVYFDTSRLENYYVFGNQSGDDLAVGVRDSVEEDENKRSKTDFVLWFTKSKFEDQELKWAVSYTHLDVYKRQVLVSELFYFSHNRDCGLFLNPVFHGNSTFQSDFNRKAWKGLEQGSGSSRPGRSRPVKALEGFGEAFRRLIAVFERRVQHLCTPQQVLPS